MLFNSLYFLVFLLAVLTIYHGVLRSFAARKLLLLAASWLFYATWSPRFLLLLIATTYVNHLRAEGCVCPARPIAQRILLAHRSRRVLAGAPAATGAPGE